jgi:endonuclease/exonuclease/phosphatase family metal-dependent hydrolase
MSTAAPQSLPASRTEEDGSAVVRVLSYNIRSMRDDTAALGRVIRACAPDLVLIQEAPRFFRWRKALTRLARSAGLVTLAGGATAAGPALLCAMRASVERTEDVLLPLTPGLHRRGFSTAVVRFGAARLGVVSCHLSLSGEERLAQARMLTRRVAELGVSHVVAGGDLNEGPGGKAFQHVAGELRDAYALRPWGGEFTSTARKPFQRIDALFVTEGVEVLGCGVPEVAGADAVAASDHLPVLAVLRVPAEVREGR